MRGVGAWTGDQVSLAPLEGVSSHSTDAYFLKRQREMPCPLPVDILVLAVFAGATRRNGFAGLHERLTGTRVVHKPAHDSVSQDASIVVVSSPSEAAPQIGPFHLIQRRTKTDREETLLAADLGPGLDIARDEPRPSQFLHAAVSHVGNVIRGARGGRRLCPVQPGTRSAGSDRQHLAGAAIVAA